MRTSTKVTAGIGGVALTLATAGVAYAYWTTSGSGSGTAATSPGQTGNLSFSPTTTDGDSTHLVTGIAPAISSAFQSTVTNQSPENAYVTQVKAYLTVLKASGVTGNCDATDYTIGKNAGSRVVGTVMPAAVDATKAVLLTWTAQDLAQNAHDVVTGSIGFNDKADTGSVDTSDFVSGNQDACKGATVTIHYLAS